MKPRRRWILLVTLVAIGVALVAWRLLRPAAVTTEAVHRGRAIEAIYATGSVEPVDKVTVKARVGEHVALIAVREGEAVTAGQLLARIESPVRAFALTQGQAQLTRAQALAGARSPQLAALAAQARALRAQLALATTELARTQRLVAAEAAPTQELDTARAHAAQLDAQAQAADADLRAARVELGATRDQLAAEVRSLTSDVDDTAVTSPLDGVVLTREVEPGELVTLNQALFEIADLRALVIELHVDEADIARVRDGATPSAVALTFYAFGSRAFPAKVLEILPGPDRVRRSYTVRVHLDAPLPGLRVGMTAEANIIVARKDDVLLLPAEALDGDAAWFVEDGRAVRRPVTVGLRDLTRVEVVTGAADGALAIVGGRPGRAGRRVSVTARAAR
jgi:HlyD family secretion protein